MGRKHHLFCWSELGAQAAWRTTLAHRDLQITQYHPYHYLVDVLQRVFATPAKDVMI